MAKKEFLTLILNIGALQWDPYNGVAKQQNSFIYQSALVFRGLRVHQGAGIDPRYCAPISFPVLFPPCLHACAVLWCNVNPLWLYLSKTYISQRAR